MKPGRSRGMRKRGYGAVLNPSFARGWHLSGVLTKTMGGPAEHCDRASRYRVAPYPSGEGRLSSVGLIWRDCAVVQTPVFAPLQETVRWQVSRYWPVLSDVAGGASRCGRWDGPLAGGLGFDQFGNRPYDSVGPHSAAFGQALAEAIVPDSKDAEPLRSGDFPFKIVAHHPSFVCLDA